MSTVKANAYLDSSGGTTATINGFAPANAAQVGIKSGTAVASTSGSAISFTNIPSWVKRITVIFGSVSTTGTSIPIVQIGAGGVPTTTGYTSGGTTISSSQTLATATNGVLQGGSMAAATVFYGQCVLTLLTGNTWVATATHQIGGGQAWSGSGTVALSGTLDNVRVTTVGGTDTFDAGSINIFWE